MAPAVTHVHQFHVRDVDPCSGDAVALLYEAWVDAMALYPELLGTSNGPPSNGPLAPRGVYAVAYDGPKPLACGALSPVDKAVAEVRRMYVHREHRRRGLATAVLSHLIGEARRLDYSRLVLETGYRQEAAMRFYERNGFKRIAPYGRHVNDPTSVCYSRAIDAG